MDFEKNHPTLNLYTYAVWHVLYGGNISLVILILFEFYVEQTGKDHVYEFDFLPIGPLFFVVRFTSIYFILYTVI